MKLVVLDGFLAGFDGLRPDLGTGHTLIWHDYTAPADVAAHIGDADGAVVNRAALGEEVFAACPNLRYVGTLGTGFNMVDLAAAARRGIVVCNAPGYSEAAVAQGTFALLLEIAGGTSRHNHYVHDGRWTNPLDRGLVDVPMMELAGKTMGIVGLGSIGMAVARIASAFGMEVIGCQSSNLPGERGGVPLLPFRQLLEISDIVSLHCPLSRRTEGMVNTEALAAMKHGAILLNTARGALLDEEAVVQALNSGKLAWFGADVLAQEPPGPENPLARHVHAVITPHVAWMPKATRQRLLDMVAENVLAFLSGNPQHVVNER